MPPKKTEIEMDKFLLVQIECLNPDCPLNLYVVDTAIIKDENEDAYYEAIDYGVCPACEKDLSAEDSIPFIAAANLLGR